MNATTADFTVSPVNIKNRQELGVKAGDTVRVHQKIEERGKTRIQVFEGIVLARKHGNEPGATFTVRKVVDGIGVEKIFPLYSPQIDKIEIIRRSKVRRAKLYYIREKVAREIKRQMRRMHLLSLATESEAEAEAREAEEAKKAEEEAAAAEEKGTEEAEQPAEEVAEEADVPADSETDKGDSEAKEEPETAEEKKSEKEADTPEEETKDEKETPKENEEEEKKD